MRLNVRAFALACGILWGLLIFSLTWWVMLIWGAHGYLTRIGLVYLGYSLTPLGSVIGLIWGFVDGLICGAILAWLYNLIAAKSEGSEKA